MERLILCRDIINKCESEYPYWEFCGYSFVGVNHKIICKNYKMIERILKEKERKE